MKCIELTTPSYFTKNEGEIDKQTTTSLFTQHG
jgi:hypothetical protein